MGQRLKLLSRAMQAGMLAVALGGIVTANFTWVPAAIASLIVSVIPSVLRRDLRLVLPVELNFFIVLALFLHVFGGFTGFYDTIPWWDHMTHVMSASLVAALGFVAVVAIDKYVEEIFLPTAFLAVFIVMFTMAFGVFWELMEFAMDGLTGSRMQYGPSPDDTMVDLLFDGFGGFIVAAAGTYYLKETTPQHFLETFKVDEASKRLKKMIKKMPGK